MTGGGAALVGTGLTLAEDLGEVVVVDAGDADALHTGTNLVLRLTCDWRMGEEISRPLSPDLAAAVVLLAEDRLEGVGEGAEGGTPVTARLESPSCSGEAMGATVFVSLFGGVSSM